MKLHDAGWKNSSFTFADVYMLGYECGVSQCIQFYDRYLYTYQVLPRSCLGMFEVDNGENFIKENLGL